jgi:hypothetical protein
MTDPKARGAKMIAGVRVSPIPAKADQDPKEDPAQNKGLVLAAGPALIAERGLRGDLAKAGAGIKVRLGVREIMTDPDVIVRRAPK